MPLSASQHGYSLLEISIVFLILAIFSGGLLQFLASHTDQENIALTKERMDEINESVKRYFVKNGFVPCAAQITLAESNASFGNSTDCSAAAPAGTWEAGATTNTSRYGMVPFRTLGLSPRYAYDAWGNRIAYGSVKRLSIDDATYNSFTTTLTDGIISVLDSPGGHSLIPSLATVYVTHIIISPGPDKQGAYSNAGAQTAACGATATADTENCDYQTGNDRVFLDMPVNNGAVTANFYNDYVRWTTNGDLEIFKDTGS